MENKFAVITQAALELYDFKIAIRPIYNVSHWYHCEVQAHINFASHNKYARHGITIHILHDLLNFFSRTLAIKSAATMYLGKGMWDI